MSEKHLKCQIKSIKSSMTRMQTFIDNFNVNSDHELLVVREDKLKEIWKRFEEVQTELEVINEEMYGSEREVYEDIFYDLQAKFNTLNIKEKKKIISETSETIINTKMPELQLPIFTGNYEDWGNFKDLFTSMVGNNKNILPVQKLYYLKAALKGEASKVISALTADPGNYEKAFKLLHEMYDNKVYQVDSHFKALLDTQQIKVATAANLKNLVINAKQHLASLETLGLPTDKWDSILIYLFVKKLDTSTCQAWQMKQCSSDLQTLDEFFTFLLNRSKGLVNVQEKDKHIEHKKYVHASALDNINNKCIVCHEQHPIYYCKHFLDKPIRDRLNIVKDFRLCFNCLKLGHSHTQCESSPCKKCKKKHNTLLHLERSHEKQKSFGESSSSSHTEIPPGKISLHNSDEAHTEILLATAQIRVKGANDVWMNCRALLDCGSQTNFVNKTLINKLQLNKKLCKTNMSINGINQINTHVDKMITLQIASKVEDYIQELNFVVLDKITCELPTRIVKTSNIKIPSNISLADPYYYQPGVIDILLGAEIFFDILSYGNFTLGQGLPSIQNTRLGWAISGKVPISGVIESSTSLHIHQETLETKMQKFWNMDNMYTEELKQTEEEKICEVHFKQTVKRNNEGRYIVTMPIKENNLELGDSIILAKKRFNYLENKLLKNHELKEQYKAFIHEYIDLGHMELVPPEAVNSITQSYYLPHHAVLRPSSTTTKLRVVFDASMKTSNGKSLNDNLMIGPTVYDELFSIILRFRKHKVAIIADLTKMYRQVLISNEQRDLQRILWRDDCNEPLQHYRLNTVTYGTASAPYLATKCIQQLALDEECNYPYASKTVKHDMYVDDLLTGTENVNQAKELQDQLIRFFKSAGFDLHKWNSNCQELIPSCEERKLNTPIGSNDAVKVLGIYWMTNEDKFKFLINIDFNDTSKYTKRKVLSDICSIFDPLGLFGPVIMRAKLFMKEMWCRKIDWDEVLEDSLLDIWKIFRNELQELVNITVDRQIISISNPITLQIHGFSDASEKAFGACLYLRAQDNCNNISVNLICSKSRVAPMKAVSLPRLELCGALILSRLVWRTVKDMKLNIKEIYLWTDSTIVLAWLNDNPTRWKTFIANRVSEIQELSKDANWNHIKSQENPADPLSRGINPSELSTLKLWWQGPHWLYEYDWKLIPNIITNTRNESQNSELKLINKTSLITTQSWELFTRYSNLIRLKRITAYCQRFFYNIKNKNSRRIDCLSTSELQTALNTLIRISQQEIFRDEIFNLKNNHVIDTKSKLLSLDPFIDDNDMLRVGGRLHNSLLPFDQKHQIILPENHILTKLIIEYEHIRLLHSGNQATLSNLRTRYWPLRAKLTIKKIIHKCLKCYRFKISTNQQIMGTLPQQRIVPTRAFLKTGIDYGGPILIRRTKHHKSTFDKAYIVLFICMVTKAIHLEVVVSLTTDDFINALRRFIARRGKCSTIYSDNASNFQGAKNELNELYKFFENQQTQNSLINFTANEDIEWNFIPPRSPHFGGLWEAGIKSVKYHLKRLIGNTKLTYEEFNTLIIQIEACVNSRPLVPISNDPSDVNPLTPGHFLIGESMHQVPEPDVTHLNINKLSRYQMLQQKLQHFWKRWHKEYIHHLQQRGKWKQLHPNIKEGDFVLIKEDNMPPLHWMMGRVIAVHLGSDGRVRVVSVKTKNGIVKRPIVKLAIMPIS